MRQVVLPSAGPVTANAPSLAVRDLGVIDYEESLRLQRRLVAERARGEGEDVLLLCEHEPVITVGRGALRGRPSGAGAGDRSALLRVAGAPIGVRVHAVERGGDVTWHGPGQLVGYPIVRLAAGPERDVRALLRRLESGLVHALADLGVVADTREGLTGIWVNGRKVASIGVAVASWVTFHGFALNVANDLTTLRAIRPCGLDGAIMTSLADILGCAPPPATIRTRVAVRLAEALGRALVPEA